MDPFADPAQADAARRVSDVRLTHMEWAAYLAAAKHARTNARACPAEGAVYKSRCLYWLTLAVKARHAATGMGWRLP